MSDSPSQLVPLPAASEPTLESLAQGQEALRTALHITLVMIIILTGSLFVFFLREVSLARRKVAELTQVVTEYEKNAVPLMEDFRTKLQVFARTHPDFAPVYAKYFGTNSANFGSATGRPQPLNSSTGSTNVRLPPGR